MDGRADVGEFLATRRTKISPQQAGLATYRRRRVPGLRREEVAMLAGVITELLRQHERGNLAGVFDAVLESV